MFRGGGQILYFVFSNRLYVMTNFFQSAPAKNQIESKELAKIVEQTNSQSAVLLKKYVPSVKKVDSKVSLLSLWWMPTHHFCITFAQKYAAVVIMETKICNLSHAWNLACIKLLGSISLYTVIHIHIECHCIPMRGTPSKIDRAVAITIFPLLVCYRATQKKHVKFQNFSKIDVVGINKNV